MKSSRSAKVVNPIRMSFEKDVLAATVNVILIITALLAVAVAIGRTIATYRVFFVSGFFILAMAISPWLQLWCNRNKSALINASTAGLNSVLSFCYCVFFSVLIVLRLKLLPTTKTLDDAPPEWLLYALLGSMVLIGAINGTMLHIKKWLHLTRFIMEISQEPKLAGVTKEFRQENS